MDLPSDLQTFGSDIRVAYSGSEHGPEEMQQESTAFWVATQEWLTENAQAAQDYCDSMGTILREIRAGEHLETVGNVLSSTYGLSGETVDSHEREASVLLARH